MGPKKLFLKLNAEGYKISFPKARELYYQYCQEFKTGVNFLRDTGTLAADQGWVQNLNGRRRYWPKPDPEDLSKFPGGREDKRYLGIMGGIERSGGNNVIQSMNAEMTKTAMVSIRNHVKKNRVRTSFWNQVYDEIVTHTHKDDTAAFHPVKIQLMKDAAHTWMKRVPMDVDGHVKPYWTKG